MLQIVIAVISTIVCYSVLIYIIYINKYKAETTPAVQTTPAAQTTPVVAQAYNATDRVVQNRVAQNLAYSARGPLLGPKPAIYIPQSNGRRPLFAR